MLTTAVILAVLGSGGTVQAAGPSSSYEDEVCVQRTRVVPRTWVESQRGGIAFQCAPDGRRAVFLDSEFPRSPFWKPWEERAASDPLMPGNDRAATAAPRSDIQNYELGKLCQAVFHRAGEVVMDEDPALSAQLFEGREMFETVGRAYGLRLVYGLDEVDAEFAAAQAAYPQSSESDFDEIISEELDFCGNELPAYVENAVPILEAMAGD